MKTIAIPIPKNDLMALATDRVGQAAHEKFVQEGIARWHKKRAEEQEKEERPQTADGGREPVMVSPE